MTDRGKQLISMIFACDNAGGIGYKNGLPWPHISEDLQHFKRITENSVVIMGSNTWDSLGGLAPLKGRTNYVITAKGLSNFTGAFDCYDYTQYTMENIITAIDFRHPGKDTIIIGGKKIYDEAYKYCDTIYMTRVMDTYKCDTIVDTDMYLDGFECRSTRREMGNQHKPSISIERWERT